MQNQPTAAYIPAYQRPDFSQGLDRARPRALLTPNPMYSGTLQYRYEDTGETVTVPNIWYNQTIESNVARLRFQAETHDDKIHQLKDSPPIGMSKESIARDIAWYRVKAKILREAASKLQKEGESFFSEVSRFLSARSPS